MRHRKRRRHKLGRKSGHRSSMIANMVRSLIIHETIRTTVTKAKLIRSYVEDVINEAKKAKNDKLNATRRLISFLRLKKPKYSGKEIRESKEKLKSKEQPSPLMKGDKIILAKLLGTLQKRFEAKNSGYSRLILDSKARVGDASPMCFVKLVNDSVASK